MGYFTSLPSYAFLDDERWQTQTLSRFVKSMLSFVPRYTTLCSSMVNSISPLEQEVMNIVWELKKCSIRDVVGKFGKDRKLAYTTIATLLQRLFDKGLVERSSEEIALSYSPKISKTSYGKKTAKTFIKSFMASFGETAIVSFAESIDKLPKDKKDYLLQLLEKQHGNK